MLLLTIYFSDCFKGKGISGASVSLGKDTKPVVTNADGVYLMENVTSGTYEIEVVKVLKVILAPINLSMHCGYIESCWKGVPTQ